MNDKPRRWSNAPPARKTTQSPAFPPAFHGVTLVIAMACTQMALDMEAGREGALANGGVWGVCPHESCNRTSIPAKWLPPWTGRSPVRISMRLWNVAAWQEVAVLE